MFNIYANSFMTATRTDARDRAPAQKHDALPDAPAPEAALRAGRLARWLRR